MPSVLKKLGIEWGIDTKLVAHWFDNDPWVILVWLLLVWVYIFYFMLPIAVIIVMIRVLIRWFFVVLSSKLCCFYQVCSPNLSIFMLWNLLCFLWFFMIYLRLTNRCQLLLGNSLVELCFLFKFFTAFYLILQTSY